MRVLLNHVYALLMETCSSEEQHDRIQALLAEPGNELTVVQ